MRDSIKLIVAAAILLIAGGLIAAFASGYISAFKPGGAKDSAQPVSYGGGGSYGAGTAALATPSPMPSPMPYPEMEVSQVPPYAGQFPAAVQQPEMPAQALAGPTGQEYFEGPYMPAQSPVSSAGLQQGPWPDVGAIANAPGPSPSTPASSQAPIMDRESPWPDGRVITDRPLPSPSPPPALQVIPQNGQPAISNGPGMPLSPYETGWLQIIQRLISILSQLFPDTSAIQSWWPQTF